MRAGSCASASRVAPTISGSASSAMTMPGDEERLPGDRSLRRCSARGSRESGLGEDQQPEDREHDRSGCPAIISIADSTARASQRGRPYSTATPRSPTPSGAAIAMPIAVTINVPDRSGRESRRSLLWCSDGAGDSTNRLRAQVGDALDEHEHHDRHGDHAQPDARRPAQPVGEPVDQRPREVAFAAAGARSPAAGGCRAGSAVAIRRRSRSA